MNLYKYTCKFYCNIKKNVFVFSDLQFQLVFSKNSSSNGLVTPTSQSEPEAKPVTTNEETSPIKEVESNV